MSYAKRHSMVAMKAWTEWTNDGRGLDGQMVAQTVKSAQDAATNVYTDDMTDEQWLAATLERLGVLK